MAVEDTTNSNNNKKQTRADWSWLWKIIILPRRALSQIIKAEKAMWLPALLALSLTALALVMANGFIKQRIGIDNPAQLPEYFQYYSAEQQQQFMQALQATSGTAFIYVLPGMVTLAKVWLGWLIVGSLVYLSLTAVGSGVKSGTIMNLVAWSSIPIVLRNLVRLVAVLASSSLIQAPGLSGFAPAGGGNSSLFLSALLGLIDLYWIWQVVLLALGGAMAGKASLAKTVGGIVFTMIVILLFKALAGYGIAMLGSSVTAVQVFF